MAAIPDILATIIAHKHTEVAAAKAKRSLAEVEVAARAAPPARDFLKALTAPKASRIIAECKRQSPSRGVMVENYDPVELAKAYERGGAAAISVLTDERFFGGVLEHMSAVRRVVGIPVLRKDFIIDEYQIYEARAAHADTFLLLSGPLDAKTLEHLIGVGRSLGMEPLIESHENDELEQALATSGKIFGVNNRNLKTFAVDLDVSRALLARARRDDPSRIVVCESGIKARKDVEAMTTAGYGVFLVGEALATSPDPEAALRDLIVSG